MILSYPLSVGASITESNNYKVDKDVLDASGSTSTSTSYKLYYNLGDSIIGSSTGGGMNYFSTYGFLTTDREYLGFGFNLSSLTLDDMIIPNQITQLTSFNMNIDSFSTNGYSIYIQSEGNGTNAGLNKSNGTAHLIASSTATLSTGTEGYGIQISSPTATLSATYNKTNNDVGGLSRISTIMASNNRDMDNEQITITPKISVNYSTPAGSYQDTITFDIVGNY